MQIKNKELKRRIIEISYKLKLSHIGSCLSAADIINDIYAKKKPDEKFVLSAGHAHLAHLVVQEKYITTDDHKHWQRDEKGWDIEHLIEKYGIHCDRRAGCDCSTGSLGHGVGIALGMALADRTKNVYCVISDGECSEGSVWETLRLQTELHVDNLLIICVINGFGAYKEINSMALANKLAYNTWARSFHVDTDWYPDFLKGQQAHYKVLDKKEYTELMRILK